MTGPGGLEAAREQAWKAYDTIARNKPGGEHNREWEQQLAAARHAFLDAIRACDNAQHEGDQ